VSVPDYRLRLACPTDAVTIAALSVQVFLDTYATEGVRPDLAIEAFETYSTEAFTQRLAQGERTFILTEAGTGLLGFAEVLLLPLPTPAGGITGAQLVRLYVQPAGHRKGIGRALLSQAEQAVVAVGLPGLWLTAWDGNLDARAFYARMGYTDIGATTYSFQGNTYANRVISRRFAGEP
jgi:GNAT superfamily N-acetyltransferase